MDLAIDPADRSDFATIVGPRTDRELADWIAACCRAQLGRDPIAVRFAHKSVGAVFGLKLAGADVACGHGPELAIDGDVVLKLFPPTFTDRELAAIDRCAARIAIVLPVPRSLGPTFARDGVRGAFTELVEGSVLDAHRPEIRGTLAAALARLAELAVDPHDLPCAPTRGATRWGPPHRIGIDYEGAGGEWIDARADAARAVVRAAALPLIAAHADWGCKNALFDRDGTLRAILDWDSLVAASEAEMVGRAAAQFTAQWELPAPLLPTAAEATAFVRQYEDARGRRLSDSEVAVANASADYLLAQLARQCVEDAARLLRETATSPLIAGP